MIVVTGGAGFIGSHLVRSALGAGYEVRVLDDLSTGDVFALPDGADLIVGDVANPGDVAGALAGAEAVVHLAAHRAVPRSLVAPLATDRANTHGTLAVLEAAARCGVGRVVLASSSSVYGPRAPLPTPETAPCEPASPYAVSKLAGEHYARVMAGQHGLSTLSLRMFNVYGEGQRACTAYGQLVANTIASLSAGSPATLYGDGTVRRDLVHVSDVVRALLVAVETREVTGVVNIGSGTSTSVLDVVHTVAAALGVPPRVHFAPPRHGDVPATQADVTRARVELGWRAATPLAAGVAATVGTSTSAGVGGS